MGVECFPHTLASQVCQEPLCQCLRCGCYGHTGKHVWSISSKFAVCSSAVFRAAQWRQTRQRTPETQHIRFPMEAATSQRQRASRLRPSCTHCSVLATQIIKFTLGSRYWPRTSDSVQDQAKMQHALAELAASALKSHTAHWETGSPANGQTCASSTDSRDKKWPMVKTILI